jgi:hypothetical protein
MAAIATLAIVDPRSPGTSRAALEAQGYTVEVLDFSDGISPAVAWLGERLRWEAQFGYPLSPASRNLDALNDGMDSDAWGCPTALELRGLDVASAEDPRWTTGFVRLARELAEGSR